MDLFITGAGVSVESGIPTFRGEDGFWTIGSINFTPQQMATRQMYLTKPDEFLLWYFKRFAKFKDYKPNEVHKWLSNKDLITQNIDGLDGKAGNRNYIPIHGRLDKVTIFHNEGEIHELIDAPWEEILKACSNQSNDKQLKLELLNAFKISQKSLKPEINISLKPFVLLFDEYYSDLYKIKKAKFLMENAKKMIFIGTSFSVNITNIALEIAKKNNCEIEIIDPNPIEISFENITYHKITASEYIQKKEKLDIKYN